MNIVTEFCIWVLTGVVIGIFIALLSFGYVQPFCHEGVQYLETYHGISVQVDKFGRVVTCH